MDNPYSTPGANIAPPTQAEDVTAEIIYIGFWERLAAMILDTILITAITYPILFALYGDQFFNSDSVVLGVADFTLSYVFPFIATVLFWQYKAATPGKMAVKAKVVDAKTYGKPSTGQLIGRYFGYILAMLPLCLGLFWVAWDKRKQGWHDKLAGTVVISSRNNQ